MPGFDSLKYSSLSLLQTSLSIPFKGVKITQQFNTIFATITRSFNKWMMTTFSNILVFYRARAHIKRLTLIEQSA